MCQKLRASPRRRTTACIAKIPAVHFDFFYSLVACLPGDGLSGTLHSWSASTSFALLRRVDSTQEHAKATQLGAPPCTSRCNLTQWRRIAPAEKGTVKASAVQSTARATTVPVSHRHSSAQAHLNLPSRQLTVRSRHCIPLTCCRPVRLGLADCCLLGRYGNGLRLSCDPFTTLTVHQHGLLVNDKISQTIC